MVAQYNSFVSTITSKMKCLLSAVFLASFAVSVSSFTPSFGSAQLASSRHAATSWASSSPSALNMSNGGVVITGSAGGVGFAYAGEFMDRGYDVVICDVKDCTSAAKALTARHPNGKVFHTRCDVSDADSVQKLAQFAKTNLGTVNYWINNAGVNGGRRDLRDVPTSQVELVVKVNLLGTLFCTKAAMEIMGEQVGFVLVDNYVRDADFRCGCHWFNSISKKVLSDPLAYPNPQSSGGSDGPYLQYGGQWCQGRWDTRICLLWCHKARAATADRKFGKGIGCGRSGVRKEKDSGDYPGPQPITGDGIHETPFGRFYTRTSQIPLWRFGSTT
jgi:hypothetical protein